MSLLLNIASIGFTSPSLPNPAQQKNLQDLIRSCALPPDPGSLQATIAVARAEIRRYEMELRKMQQPEDRRRLVSECQSLSSYVDGCRSVLSALYRLTDDVLVEIFAWCFPERLYRMSRSLWWRPTIRTEQEDEVKRISHRHVLQLAHVCSRWYHVAMKTPKLWSTFVVDADLWLRKDSLLPLLESSLDRGQNHPLNLTLSISPFCRDGEEVLELFVKHAHRWRELYLHCTTPPDRLAGATGKLDRLEKLYLIRTRNADQSWKEVQVFQDAPRLTELEFDGFPSSLPKLPWAQINTCTCLLLVDSGCRYHPLTVLLHASCTSSYRIVLDLWDSGEPWNLEISSEVQNLQIWFSRSRSVVTGKLFDCLTLPRVKTLGLRLAHDFHPPVWHCDSFLALAERSQFYNVLLNLAIEKVQVEDTDLLRCLEVLPQLLSLDISDCTTVISITDTLLKGLVYSSGLSSLVPRLERLYLASKSKFSSQVYLDLVVSRVESCYFNSRGAFEVFLLQRSRWGGELSSSVLEKLSELVSQKKIIFTLGRC
ncbi:hypothetical protein R3P38DRAFT_1462541 [Favolaschia claudopus]|uniref:F-box domain-containing protein n=1 Tax=Favolaschia claudopus TaxID=2862362 RepID=A0AAW0DLC9_9AGAR